MEIRHERRKNIEISEEQIEQIADRAAEKVWDNFTLHVGRVTIRTVLQVGGVAGTALAAWLAYLGKIG